MIAVTDKNDERIIAEAIAKDPFQNVYLSIDVKNHGFYGDNIKTYLLRKTDEIYAVVFFYYNSIQLFQISEITDDMAEELAGFVEENRIVRVSGAKSIIKKMSAFLKNKYRESDGYILKYCGDPVTASGICSFAEGKDMPEIAELILADDDMGKGYSYQSLLKQMRDRLQTSECVNLCVKDGDEIVAHLATYAESDSMAILSGLIVREDHRGKGYGKLLVNDLTAFVTGKGKEAVSYCYQDAHLKLFETYGYYKAGLSCKLEVQY